jgi:hypothetical protein
MNRLAASKCLSHERPLLALASAPPRLTQSNLVCLCNWLLHPARLMTIGSARNY